MRVQQQLAYVLLNRPYSETSWIVEVYSRDFGRISLMAKGARRLKSKLKGVLLPFQPLIISWSGKGEVPTLTLAEVDGELIDLKAESRICGFYCNELIVHLLHRHDPHPKLFMVYQKTINKLATAEQTEQSSLILRNFERSLIKEIGYEVNFQHQAHSTIPIEQDAYYIYQQGQGFVPSHAEHPQAVSGKVIYSVGRQSNNQNDTQAGKEIMRQILNQLLEHKKIHSRALFFPKSR